MIQKTLIKVAVPFTLALGLFTLIPSHAMADFNPLDPFCLFSCNDNNQPVNNISNSYNGSYNNTTSYTAPAPVVVNNTPVYSTPVYTTPVYTTPVYNYSSPVYYNNYSSPLQVTCYSSPTYASVGSTVTWGSSVNGGNGSYYITWSGSEGLYGSGSSILKSYSYGGAKTASITVTSGGQTVSQNCSGSVLVTDNGYNYSSNVYYAYNNYPVSVSCSSNVVFSPVGSYVVWTAYPVGGYNGYGYSYTWSGTDGLYGSQSSISTTYNNPGIKNAYVTVYSNGGSTSAQCSNTVTVGAPVSNYYNGYTNYNYNSNLGLQIACAADVASTKIGVPVTWTVEAVGSGNMNNLTYAWTGSDGLSGNQSAIITTYRTAGQKSAVVTVTAPNGQSQSKACSNTINVKKAAAVVAKAPTKQAPQVVTLPASINNSGAAFLSLNNVPWGWVAILVILVLMGMVFYLMYNKKKLD